LKGRDCRGICAFRGGSYSPRSLSVNLRLLVLGAAEDERPKINKGSVLDGFGV